MALFTLTAGSILTGVLSISFIVGVIARVIGALGFTALAFTGIDYALDAMTAQLNQYLTGVPLTAKAILDMSGITTIVFWLINAYTFKALFGYAKPIFVRSSSIA